MLAYTSFTKMPNWCDNYLIVTGATAIAFSNNNGTFIDRLLFSIAMPSSHEEPQVFNVHHEENCVKYTFWTAWEPPIEWIKRVGSSYPTLTFALYYAEGGMDFRGHIIMKHGCVVSLYQSTYFREATHRDVLQMFEHLKQESAYTNCMSKNDFTTHDVHSFLDGTEAEIEDYCNFTLDDVQHAPPSGTSLYLKLESHLLKIAQTNAIERFTNVVKMVIAIQTLQRKFTHWYYAPNSVFEQKAKIKFDTNKVLFSKHI